MLILVVILFMACWGPKIVFIVIQKNGLAQTAFHQWVYNTKVCLGLLPFVHSCLNPIIYRRRCTEQAAYYVTSVRDSVGLCVVSKPPLLLPTTPPLTATSTPPNNSTTNTTWSNTHSHLFHSFMSTNFGRMMRRSCARENCSTIFNSLCLGSIDRDKHKGDPLVDNPPAVLLPAPTTPPSLPSGPLHLENGVGYDLGNTSYLDLNGHTSSATNTIKSHLEEDQVTRI
ncbi:hypothetical protein Pcinc_015479 [Petrolisthes cinctipes]|uniref:G-protein coupled receptors family 1 profile domain-containing protein n=1 Tax=Petrolisthes cinctipes TaxID=88211 RepID=A0AAE1KQP0_PETCI|nr:hypothetical protein Pcinc_015479 [Petrolisthes cinctipes]